ncbi:hypothetical protein [Brachybacterium sp. 107]|uniref:hypothetical protein n=1 Tax=Brachybacterium sp. 107 TaxID=3457736 RepID=UPI004034A130
MAAAADGVSELGSGSAGAAFASVAVASVAFASAGFAAAGFSEAALCAGVGVVDAIFGASDSAGTAFAAVDFVDVDFVDEDFVDDGFVVRDFVDGAFVDDAFVVDAFDEDDFDEDVFEDEPALLVVRARAGLAGSGLSGASVDPSVDDAEPREVVARVDAPRPRRWAAARAISPARSVRAPRSRCG